MWVKLLLDLQILGYSAPPDTTAIIRGRGEEEGKGRSEGREGVGRREEKGKGEWNGRGRGVEVEDGEGRERGGRARHGIFVQRLRVPSYATGHPDESWSMAQHT